MALINGTEDDDLLIGTADADIINGLDGNDLIEGLGGDDIMDGGDGEDTASYVLALSGVNVNLLLQGSAQDTLGAGIDTLNNFENLTGSAFNDSLIGDGGSNVLLGGDGDDYVDGFSGSDFLDAGAGNDWIDGSTDIDWVSYASATAGVTVNFLLQHSWQDTIGAGIDYVANFENLEGSEFDDTLTGDDAANEINGLGGDDLIEGLGGDDIMDGGDGEDTASYVLALSGVSVNLLLQGSGQDTLGAGIDTLSNFENLTGSTFNDSLSGDTGSNVLNGGDGVDQLYGDAGDDVLIVGGAVSNVRSGEIYNGGEGTDALRFDAGVMRTDGHRQVSFHLAQLSSIERLEFGETSTGVTFALFTTLQLGAGLANNAHIVGSANHDDVVFLAIGGGTHSLAATNFTFENWTEHEDYWLGDHIVLSATTPGNYTLIGSERAELIQGNVGADIMQGGDGDDTLMGREGVDVYDGGAGEDIFVIGSNDPAYIEDYALETFNGGADTDLLWVVGQYVDLTNSGIVLSGMEGIGVGGSRTHFPGPPPYATAPLLGGEVVVDLALLSQLPTALIVSGSDGYLTPFGEVLTQPDVLTVVLQPGDALNMSSWTFLRWESQDRLNVIGSSANDTIIGSTIGDFVHGGDGADNIQGRGGSDTIDGGAGNDTLNGGIGSDTVSYAAETDAMFVDLGAGTTRRGSAVAPVEDTLSAIENVAGGAGNDAIVGANNANTLSGDGGDDVITGAGGADTIAGGAGNDAIAYTIGDGSDDVDGGEDFDTLSIIGTAAANTLNVTYDGASLTGFEAGTLLSIESVSADLGLGGDTLTYAGSTASVSVNLSASTASGFSSVFGVENVTGGDGHDTLAGDGAANSLNGGVGNDTLEGGAGEDTLNGAGGVDTASYASETDALFINLAAGNMRRGSVGAPIEDTLSAIENATGGSGNDSINGTSNANAINGNDGNDTIAGLGGADAIAGGAGEDTIAYTIGDGADAVDGGADFDSLAINGTSSANTLDVIYDGAALIAFESGATANIEAVTSDLGLGVDTLNYAGTTVGVVVNLDGAAASGFSSIMGIENAMGGDGDDTLTGDGAANRLEGGAGADTLTGGAGADTMVGGAHDDTYFADSSDTISETAGGGMDIVFTSAAAFTLAGNVENLTSTGLGDFDGTGNASDNVIVAGNGSNTLNGNGGADTLIGGTGIDTLSGGGGGDVLIGGAGDDAMNGGTGADRFVFASGFGNDAVSDFDANPNGGQDLIDISAMGITAADFASRVTIVDLGPDTQITIDGNMITLFGVNGVGANSMQMSDFILGP
jgi:Ca2+-binding RTX toxin-like protein